jgi:hypothetical protein
MSFILLNHLRFPLYAIPLQKLLQPAFTGLKLAPILLIHPPLSHHLNFLNFRPFPLFLLLPHPLHQLFLHLQVLYFPACALFPQRAGLQPAVQILAGNLQLATDGRNRQFVEQDEVYSQLF